MLCRARTLCSLHCISVQCSDVALLDTLTDYHSFQGYERIFVGEIEIGEIEMVDSFRLWCLFLESVDDIRRSRFEGSAVTVRYNSSGPRRTLYWSKHIQFWSKQDFFVTISCQQWPLEEDIFTKGRSFREREELPFLHVIAIYAKAFCICRAACALISTEDAVSAAIEW